MTYEQQKANEYRLRYNKKHRWAKLCGKPNKGVCQLCGAKEKVYWNYKHSGDEFHNFRGWLCLSCDSAIRAIEGKSESWLHEAMKFLARPPAIEAAGLNRTDYHLSSLPAPATRLSDEAGTIDFGSDDA